jgi:hypothetical protein
VPKEKTAGSAEAGPTTKRASTKQAKPTETRAGAPPAGAPPIGVTLVVEDDSLGDLDAVLRRVRKAGLRDGQVLPSAGVITGTARPDAIEDLARVRGIRAAEAERTFQLPPPDQPQ